MGVIAGIAFLFVAQPWKHIKKDAESKKGASPAPQIDQPQTKQTPLDVNDSLVQDTEIPAAALRPNAVDNLATFQGEDNTRVEQVLWLIPGAVISFGVLVLGCCFGVFQCLKWIVTWPFATSKS